MFSTFFRRRSHVVTVFAIGILFSAVASPATAFAQTASADADLKARVEALAHPAGRTVGGIQIAAHVFLPKLYAALGYQPVWTNFASVDALSKMIARSWEDGLLPSDFHADYVKAAITAAPQNLAEREIILSDALVRLLYQLYFGKVAPNGLDPNWNFARPVLTEDPAQTIGTALKGGDITGLVENVSLKHPLYIELKAMLQQYTQFEASGGWPKIPDGPPLKPGQTDPRIAILRERLKVTGQWEAGAVVTLPDLYDQATADAVETFQAGNGLEPDGILGPGTLAALNVTASERVDQLRANLERGRWLLRTMGPEAVVVNVAGFYLHVFFRSEKVWTTRVIVGQSYTKTPVFTEAMKSIVLNPDWTVPQSIVRAEIFPKASANPGYLTAGNYYLADSSGRSMSDVDFAAYTPASFPYRVVQRPGPKNALGRVKFLFPNKYSVYLHDTPNRQLFDKSGRTFSHGCIRVEDPLKLAEIILSDRLGWDRAKIDAAVASGKMQSIALPKPLPVLILYWTVDPSPIGGATFHRDIYGRDARLIRALDAPFKP
jgi:murein L,D-transpeptidase YcbB/YkuD